MTKGGPRMDLLERLLDFDPWAMNELFDASEGLTDAQLDEEFDIGHRTIRATFPHIIYNIHFWTSFMLGEQPKPEPDGLLTESEMREWYDEIAQKFAALNRQQEGTAYIPVMRDWYAENYEEFANLARRFRDEEKMDETFVDHYQVKKSMGGTVLTVLLHNTEHRAEIVHMLHRVGVENVPEVDIGARDYELQNL